MPTTSATSSLVTALGGGSGIDMAALAANLATAQFASRTDRLSARSELLDRQISAASTIKSQLQQLTSALGERMRTGDLSPQPQVANSSVASASLVTAATPSGSYSLEVLALASSQTLTSPALAASSTVTGSGTLTLRFGTVAATSFTEDTAHAPVAIAIPSGATLAEVAAAINGSGAGISAYVANGADGAHLMLKGKDGAANGFILEAVETPGEEGLANLAWNPAAGDAARLLGTAGDARFKLDGLAMSSATNVVTQPAPGFNLTLRATNIGTPTRITFGDPGSAISGFMQDFVTALNEVATTLGAAVDPKSGDLARDPGARALRQSLTQLAGTVIMPSAAGTAPRTLADLGLATERNGAFRLDATRLAATLQRDPAGVAAMFTTGLYGVYATLDGISRKSTSLANPASLGGSITRLTSQQAKVKEDLATIADKQETLRASLAQRFAVADVRVGASHSTLSFLQQQIDAWNAPRN
jgi:flagellar hook-associated protein 2